jgi:hypothetical protein
LGTFLKGEANELDLVCISFGKLITEAELEGISDRMYVTKIDEGMYLDASGFLKEDNPGTFIQDGFDDDLQNIGAQSYQVDDDLSNVVGYFALRKLVQSEELYRRYGKWYWCYEDNQKMLNKKQKAKCFKYYDIDEEDFIQTIKQGQGKKKPARKRKT